MSKFKEQLNVYLSQLNPTEQSEILERAVALASEKSPTTDLLNKTLGSSEVSTPAQSFLDLGNDKLDATLNVVRGKNQADLELALGKMGDPWSEFQKRQLDARGKDRWLAGGLGVADMLARMSLINKL